MAGRPKRRTARQPKQEREAFAVEVYNAKFEGWELIGVYPKDKAARVASDLRREGVWPRVVRKGSFFTQPPMGRRRT